MSTQHAAGNQRDALLPSNDGTMAGSKARLQWLTYPATIALAVTAIYAIRFANCLPFSGNTRIFNYETITTLTSYFLYVQEPLSFPLGTIERLTFPFVDANVGNVGALPLFAVTFKLLGWLIPYFKNFDFFPLVELIACFFTAYFSQLILIQLDVRSLACRALGALLTATSLMILLRSAWLQAFCVVSFPLFTAWMYGMLLTLRRSHWRPAQDLLVLSIFPAAALLDNYTLCGLMLGTGALIVRETFEAFFSQRPASLNRLSRLVTFCIGGVLASVGALYIVGMFPLPPVSSTFTSYDFGMGGRYHVADLLSPFIPIANKVYGFVEPSLLGRYGFPFTTDKLAPGQYEGAAFIGTPVLILWIVLAARAVSIWFKRRARTGRTVKAAFLPYSPWKKIFIAAAFVFLFSLGYELHVFGRAFPNFAGMPGAWISDRIPSLYNFRAPGRLAALMTLFLILEAMRRLSAWQMTFADHEPGTSRRPLWFAALSLIAVVHLVEVGQLLRPVKAQPLNPLGGVFSSQEIDTLKRLGRDHTAVLVAPSVLAVDTMWTTTAFSLVYHMGIKSNLFYLARAVPAHADIIDTNLRRVLAGDWDALTTEYGNLLFVLPGSKSAELRDRMQGRYQETVVGPVSVWSRPAGR